VIGLFLFATGLVAVYAVSSPRPAAAVGEPLTDPAVATRESDRIDGVGSAVEEVLSSYGKAGRLDADELSQIPPEVAQALVDNGVALVVVSRGER
jgi:hypothetical protein